MSFTQMNQSCSIRHLCTIGDLELSRRAHIQENLIRTPWAVNRAVAKTLLALSLSSARGLTCLSPLLTKPAIKGICKSIIPCNVLMRLSPRPELCLPVPSHNLQCSRHVRVADKAFWHVRPRPNMNFATVLGHCHCMGSRDVITRQSLRA